MNKFIKNKSDVIAWLDQYSITDYKLIKDHKHGYVANVDGDVELLCNNLMDILVKFGNVSGHFYCGYNKLISLVPQGFPLVNFPLKILVVVLFVVIII